MKDPKFHAFDMSGSNLCMRSVPLFLNSLGRAPNLAILIEEYVVNASYLMVR